MEKNSSDKTKWIVENYKVRKSIKSKVHNVEDPSTKRFTPLSVKLFNMGGVKYIERKNRIVIKD